jgi:ABC-2 type transport system permease protein
LNGLRVSLWAEYLKIRKSKAFVITVTLFAFVALVLGLLVLAGRHPEISGRSAAISAKASLVGHDDWPSYWNVLIQVILSLGTMGFGFVASWVFGREYSDRTIKDLLALPVSRLNIVMSKIIVIVIWCMILSLTLLIIGLVTGLSVNIQNWSTQSAFYNIKIFLTSSILTILLCTPVTFIASLGRGYLLSLGFVILSLVMTNLIAIGAPGVVPYFPWAFPALISGIGGIAMPQITIWSCLIFIVTVIMGYLGTVFWWRFADQT